MMPREVGDIWFYQLPGFNNHYLLLRRKENTGRESWDVICLETGQYCMAEFNAFSISSWKKIA